MALLYVANRVMKRFAPWATRESRTTSEVVIGGAGKFVIESTLLNTEMMIYTTGFGMTALHLAITDGSMAVPVGFVAMASFEAVKLGVPSLIAAVRTGHAMYKGTTHIVNVSPGAAAPELR